ncbi:MAG TPA: twin-arginine translocase TatA/TatE family subunit [Actinomycetota bacterium]|nr:twin-arginine translocase TatA/TatE family subunit [Actinomycetota bacterium]
MPSIGFGEILVILLLGLIIFGPKRLPEMGRTVGRSLREFRRAAADLRAEIESDADDDIPRVPAPTDQPVPGQDSAETAPPDQGPPQPDQEPPRPPRPGQVPPT